MKKIIADGRYTFDASAKQITLLDYSTIYLAGFALITNVTDGILIFQFNNAALGGTVATNVLTLTYNSTTMDDGDKLQIIYDDGADAQVKTTVVKAVEQVTDWTAVAQNIIGESATLDCSLHEKTLLCIQAFLDTTTAHTGTKFIVQISSNTSGDKDWHDYTEFVGLIGTAATDLIEDNPLAAGSTSIALTGHALTVRGIWLAIEDGTLANSELIFEVSSSANAVVILDGTTTAHAANVAIFNVAFSNVILIDASVIRVRVLAVNSYDSDGSTLNFRIRCSKVTSM
jgi:hypothetical protein